MLRLLLSVEQYAAMQLCGSKIPVSSILEQENIQDLEQIAQNSDRYKGFDVDSINKRRETKTSIINIKSNKKQLATISPMQLATLSPIQLIDQEELDLKKEKLNYGDIMNHLEKIDRIERDEMYFQKSVNQFLKNNFSSTDELNKRIIGCMIGTEQAQSLVLDNEKNF